MNSTFSTIQVKWLPNPSPLVEAYVIECAQLPSGKTIRTELVNATNTTIEIDGLESSTNYSIRLHTVTWCKNGSWSKAVIVTTKDGGKDRSLFPWPQMIDLAAHSQRNFKHIANRGGLPYKPGGFLEVSSPYLL